MLIGQYNRLLSLYKYDQSRDSMGNPVKTPLKIATKWGNIKENAGNELNIEGKIYWEYNATITTSLWNLPEENQFFVDDKGRKFEILYKIDIPEFNETRLTCKRIKGI